MSQPSELFAICSYRAHGSIITPIIGFEDEAKAELNKAEYNKKADSNQKYIIQRIRVYE
ncbi:MAG: hypothetical protein ABF747_02405 [Bifidobacterium sp.]|uniref:Uncharacterized protein n=1 Tax=Bifidobacterium fermentum TaxID=3059035 RepID=A0AB39UHN3_9BIFI